MNPVARPLFTQDNTNTEETRRRHPCLAWDSNPPSVFEQAKTFLALDRAATVTGAK
jgi:hypothetical protein